VLFSASEGMRIKLAMTELDIEGETSGSILNESEFGYLIKKSFIIEINGQLTSTTTDCVNHPENH
jgi:hypothetical protein